MTAGSMLAELDAYYRRERISAVAFDCAKYRLCSAGCTPGNFVTAREAFVGTEYEKGVLPRLLFLSRRGGLLAGPEAGGPDTPSTARWRRTTVAPSATGSSLVSDA